LLRKVK